MSSSKEYCNFILEQLSKVPNIPYPGAKPMSLVEDVDDKEELAKIINNTIKGLTCP